MWEIQSYQFTILRYFFTFLVHKVQPSMRINLWNILHFFGDGDDGALFDRTIGSEGAWTPWCRIKDFLQWKQWVSGLWCNNMVLIVTNIIMTITTISWWSNIKTISLESLLMSKEEVLESSMWMWTLFELLARFNQSPSDDDKIDQGFNV